jgi:hypothetical protein
MSITVEQLVSDALDLPLQVRAYVAEKLIESLDDTPSPVLSLRWRKEIDKRCREIDEGLVELRNVDDVFEKAYSTLG